jgi:hypothetical protein
MNTGSPTMRHTTDKTVVPLAVAWQLHCGACGEPVQAAESDGWSAARSFTTRLRFTLQRRSPDDAGIAGDHPARRLPPPAATQPAGPTDPRDAALISGSYSVSYNAARCTLTLTGTLDIDGSHYFVDDVLTMDLASIDGDGDGAGDDAAPGHTASSLPIERLAGLAVMTHLGLRHGR